jgi:hypothetical protein
MRKTLACVCVIALVPTGVLGQAPGGPTSSPEPSRLLRSVASAVAAFPLDRPATPLAGDQDRDEASGWMRVEAIQPGSEITLTVTGTPAAKAQLLVASPDAVFVLRPGGPKLSGRVSRALVGVASQWPAIFSGGAAYSLADGVRRRRDLRQQAEGGGSRAGRAARAPRGRQGDSSSRAVEGQQTEGRRRSGPRILHWSIHRHWAWVQALWRQLHRREGARRPVGHRVSGCPRHAWLLPRQSHCRGHDLPRAATGSRPDRRSQVSHAVSR